MKCVHLITPLPNLVPEVDDLRVKFGRRAGQDESLQLLLVQVRHKLAVSEPLVVPHVAVEPLTDKYRYFTALDLV